MPQLAFPFAAIGLAAGWLSDALLANPAVGVSLRTNQELAAGISALVCAVLGAALTRRCVLCDLLLATEVPRPLLAVYVIIGGVVAGGAVGGLARDSMFGLVSGAVSGALCAVAFLPVCALVLTAARRANRARLGSIVAGTDRRAVWGIMATALSVMMLAALPDWPASRYGTVAPPRVALGMTAGAGLLILAILVADAVALTRVARVARTEMEPRDRDEADRGEAIPELDLGLGEQVLATLSRSAAAYRSRDRVVALLIGSVGEARAALRRALLRGVLGLAIAAAVLSCHSWAAGTGALIAYNGLRCAQSSPRSCYYAGLILQGDTTGAAGKWPAEAWPRDVEGAEVYHLRACAGGMRRGCDALVASLKARDAAGTVELPYWYSVR
jgi:hypothetical protein